MKFALALIATVSAIRIQAPSQCVSRADSDHVFDLVHANGDGQVNEAELRAAVGAFLDAHDIHPTKAQVRDFGNAAAQDAGADRRLNPAEFNSLANQVAHYVAPNKCSA